jgi:hypothetical protein
LPIVDLMCKDLTFCQFFLRSETRKLIPKSAVINKPYPYCIVYVLYKYERGEVDVLIITLDTTCSSVIWTCPTATPRQRTFFSWNLMVERTSVSLLVRSSACETGVGNLPALERPGPSRRGICLRRVSELRKASYFFASFFTNFLFLFSLGLLPTG